jgi:serine/threonine protein kinase
MVRISGEIKMSFDAKPGDIIGAYYIKKELSKGGMAYVVLASSKEKNYALKITRVGKDKEKNEQNATATRKEVEYLRNLSHDRLVKVFQLKVDNKRMEGKKVFYARAQDIAGSPWYFAMEYLAGGTLDNYVRVCGPLTVAEATNITGNIGLAIGYLHDKGIVHNDIKPENVMFRKKIKKNQPYDPVLIDFGTAGGMKNFKDEAGTWYTMSPERVRGAKGIDPPEKTSLIDPAKADVWSLGILLYQALTNSLPFPSSNQRRLTSQILNDIPKKILKRNGQVPMKLNDFIITDCLAKNPQDRPTVREFLLSIYEYSGRGVLATSIKENYYEQ